MQPLIIFGTRPRLTVIDEGTFHCPNCSESTGQPRTYQHQQVRNYFTLYFVPIFPLGAGEEIVRCSHCTMIFEPDVLNQTFKPKRHVLPLASQLNTLQQRLEDGLAVEYAVADLTAAGLDRELAKQNVTQVIGGKRRQCPACNLTYAPAVARCTEDDTPLVKPGVIHDEGRENQPMRKLDRALERMYGELGLTDELTDDEAEILLRWGENAVTQLDAATDDEETFDAQFKQVRRLMKRVNRFVGAHADYDPAEAQEKLAKLRENAAELHITLDDARLQQYISAQAGQPNGEALRGLLDLLSPPPPADATTLTDLTDIDTPGEDETHE
jgi:hypothetical protein